MKISIIFLLIFTGSYYSQNDTTIYKVAEIRASFPGGEVEMMSYLAKNIVYPNQELKASIESRFYIKLVVEKNGSISNVEPLQNKSNLTELHHLFIEENKEIFYKMPKWNPAILNGEKVRSIYTIPLHIHWK